MGTAGVVTARQGFLLGPDVHVNVDEDVDLDMVGEEKEEETLVPCRVGVDIGIDVDADVDADIDGDGNEEGDRDGDGNEEGDRDGDEIGTPMPTGLPLPFMLQASRAACRFRYQSGCAAAAAVVGVWGGLNKRGTFCCCCCCFGVLSWAFIETGRLATCLRVKRAASKNFCRNLN